MARSTRKREERRYGNFSVNGVTLVKIWVDGRAGSVPKIRPDVYRAIIDEAHANAMRVVAHLGRTDALADAKDLLRAGIDGFAHTRQRS